MAEEKEPRVVRIPLDALYSARQVRRRFAGIDELAQSMAEVGQLVPIVVSEDPEGGRYRIEQGERRWRAAQAAGMPALDAFVRPRPASSCERIIAQLTENVQRDEMALPDLAAAIDELIAGGMSRTDIAQRLGMDRGYIGRLAEIAHLPGYLAGLVDEGKVTDSIAAVCLKHAYDYSDNPDSDIASLADDEGCISRSRARAYLAKLKRVAAGLPALEASTDPSAAGLAPQEPDAGPAPWEDAAQMGDAPLDAAQDCPQADAPEAGGVCLKSADSVDMRRLEDHVLASRGGPSGGAGGGSSGAALQQKMDLPGLREIPSGGAVHVRVSFATEIGGQVSETVGEIPLHVVSDTPGLVAVQLETGDIMLVDASRLTLVGVEGDF